VPGVHNVLNATAAIAVGVGLDVGVEAICAALDQFRGVDRRFQLRGRAAGVSVIDDYGHHPTEIKATLAAARQCGLEIAEVCNASLFFDEYRKLHYNLFVKAKVIEPGEPAPKTAQEQLGFFSIFVFRKL